MADETIVVNTGPLITLARIDALEIAGALPYDFVCPREGRDELDAGEAAGHVEVRPPWLAVLELQATPRPTLVAGLDRGEAAVIQLALERGTPRACIDEWKARRAAAAAGLRVTGTLGLLGRAKRLGLIPTGRPLGEQARQAGVRYHDDIVRAVLRAAGEPDE